MEFWKKIVTDPPLSSIPMPPYSVRSPPAGRFEVKSTKRSRRTPSRNPNATSNRLLTTDCRLFSADFTDFRRFCTVNGQRKTDFQPRRAPRARRKGPCTDSGGFQLRTHNPRVSFEHGFTQMNIPAAKHRWTWVYMGLPAGGST